MKKSALVVALFSAFVAGSAFAGAAVSGDAAGGDNGVKVTTDTIHISDYDAKIIRRAVKVQRGSPWAIHAGVDKIQFAGTFKTDNSADIIRAKSHEPLVGQCHDFTHGIFVCKTDGNDLQDVYGGDIDGLPITSNLRLRYNVTTDGSRTLGRFGGFRYTLSDVDLSKGSADGHSWEKVTDVDATQALYRRIH